jgi:hypothetical protein
MSNDETESLAIAGVQAWNELVESRDPAGLGAILADDAQFHSPVVHSPQKGKAIVTAYLTAAMKILDNGSFRYLRQVAGESDAVLEFITVIDGIEVNGVDMIHWNEEGKIDDFKVMLRPLKAVNLIHQMMAAALNARGR